MKLTIRYTAGDPPRECEDVFEGTNLKIIEDTRMNTAYLEGDKLKKEDPHSKSGFLPGAFEPIQFKRRSKEERLMYILRKALEAIDRGDGKFCGGILRLTLAMEEL